jgi:hypothetical protein
MFLLVLSVADRLGLSHAALSPRHALHGRSSRQHCALPALQVGTPVEAHTAARHAAVAVRFMDAAAASIVHLQHCRWAMWLMTWLHHLLCLLAPIEMACSYIAQLGVKAEHSMHISIACLVHASSVFSDTIVWHYGHLASLLTAAVPATVCAAAAAAACRHWRLTGVAHELRDSAYTAANSSLLSTAYGRSKEYKDRWAV